MHSLSISYLVRNLRIYLFLFPNLIQKLFWGRWLCSMICNIFEVPLRMHFRQKVDFKSQDFIGLFVCFLLFHPSLIKQIVAFTGLLESTLSMPLPPHKYQTLLIPCLVVIASIQVVQFNPFSVTRTSPFQDNPPMLLFLDTNSIICKISAQCTEYHITITVLPGCHDLMVGY